MLVRFPHTHTAPIGWGIDDWPSNQRLTGALTILDLRFVPVRKELLS